MKTFVKALLCSTSAVLAIAAAASAASTPSAAQVQAAALPRPTAYSVAQRGPNHKVWERTVYEPSAWGPIARPHHYTELEAGMHYWANGQWNESSEAILPLPGGGAAATNGQYQVYFPSDIYRGVIEQVTPEGLHLKSRPIGISYFDGTNNVLVAELTNSLAQILPSGNQLIWTNCLTDGIVADLVCTYRKGRFECDLVFRSRPPSPEAFGLDADRCRLQVLTEFFDTPEPVQSPALYDPQYAMLDTTLAFGSTRMWQGKAFAIQKPATASIQGAAAGPSAPHASVPVFKTWLHAPGGRTVLFEEIPYERLKPDLDELALADTGGAGILPASPNRLRRTGYDAGAPNPLSAPLVLPAQRAPHPSAEPVRFARSDLAGRPGVVLDYVDIIMAQSDFTFLGNTTYVVRGTFAFSGKTTIQAGAMLKFDDSTSPCIEITGTLDCRALPFCQSVLTDMNDDLIGEWIPGSTGTPGTQANSCYLLLDDPSSSYSLSNLRFCYAHVGLGAAGGNPVDVWDCQFLYCYDAIQNANGSAPVAIHNGLFANCNAAVQFSSSERALTGEHLTVAGTSLWETQDSFPPSAVNMTNSLIIAAVGSEPTFNTNCVVLNPEGAVFQVAGAGSYYLSDCSPYRNAGTTNLSPAMLADLAQRTTYPPVIYDSASIATPTVFSSQALRDRFGNPDLGYHYFPLDVIFGGTTVSSDVTFSPGTSAGWFSGGPDAPWGAGFGMGINPYSTVRFNGTASAPCSIVRFDGVQEGCAGTWPYVGWLGGIVGLGDGGDPPPTSYLNLQFTRCSALMGPNHFRDYGSLLVLRASHSEFYSGSMGGYWIDVALTNCLLHQVGYIAVQCGGAPGPAISLEGCTMLNGFLLTSRWANWPVTITDCAFENTGFSSMDNPYGAETSCDYNAFLTNASRTAVQGVHDVILTNGYNWQTSWLGRYYLPTNSPLIDAGSTTADHLGLYHFTTQTNQLKETNSIVDIGYHVIAVDTNGVPVDSNGDGVPDYASDANGNGQVDSGETGWNIVGDLGLKVRITRPKNNSKLP